MTSLRSLTVAAALLTLTVTVPSLWAKPTAVSACCGGSADCPGYAPRCCVYEEEFPCSYELPGFCQSVCIPVTR